MASFLTAKGESVFRVHWICWKFLGQAPNETGNVFYYLWGFAVNTLVTIGYPLHLIIGLFNSETQYDVFKMLAISLPCLVCSIKSLIIWWKLYQVQRITQIIRKLDKRVTEPSDVDYYRLRVFPAAKRVLHLFYFICLGSALSSEVAVVITGFLKEWRLMYPAYFPFNAYDSRFKYLVAHLYQFLGISVQIVQNLINDTYGAMGLAMLAGHCRLLGTRVSKIGFDPDKTLEENNNELVACIQDHKDLLEFRYVIEDVMSLCLFIQIIFSAVNMCVVIIFMIFYLDDAFSYIYYTIYLFAMPMEIFPVCYYGSYFELEFEKLTHSIFSCNWMDQSKAFKQNLKIFAEQSLKKINALACGMFHINLDSFFATCKTAYSLFAVVMQMK